MCLSDFSASQVDKHYDFHFTSLYQYATNARKVHTTLPRKAEVNVMRRSLMSLVVEPPQIVEATEAVVPAEAQAVVQQKHRQLKPRLLTMTLTAVMMRCSIKTWSVS